MVLKYVLNYVDFVNTTNVNQSWYEVFKVLSFLDLNPWLGLNVEPNYFTAFLINLFGQNI